MLSKLDCRLVVQLGLNMERLIISPYIKIKRKKDSGHRTRNMSLYYHAKEKLILENVSGKAQG